MKQHILVYLLGLLHAILMTIANITDRKGAIEAIIQNISSLLKVEAIMVDGGYTGKDFANTVKTLLGAIVEVTKRSELHAFKAIPKRWIVERSFACLGKCRRLWKNTERKLNTNIQFVNLDFYPY